MQSAFLDPPRTLATLPSVLKMVGDLIGTNPTRPTHIHNTDPNNQYTTQGDRANDFASRIGKTHFLGMRAPSGEVWRAKEYLYKHLGLRGQEVNKHLSVRHRRRLINPLNRSSHHIRIQASSLIQPLLSP